MQKINLIRHAKTNDNHEFRYSGSIESELIWSPDKIRRIILPKLPLEEMGQIYSSPRKRAIDTAKPFVGEERSLAIDDNIREINFGEYEGLTFEEIVLKYPQEVEKWAVQKNAYIFPKGDSLDSFYKRAVDGFKDIMKNSNTGDNITIFTHGGVIQCLISYLLSDSVNLFWNFKIDNCSLTQFYFENGTAVFKKINY